MEILCISDILWETPGSDILQMLKTEIDESSPSLVLFGGDVINDGMNSEEHVDEFVELLHHLEESETPSFTIPGNHDEYSNYVAVEAEIEALDHAEEISLEVAEFDGLKVLGIPYSATNYLTDARALSEKFPEEYDVLLAHAEASRRIWLFELEARFIITGHFAEKLCQARDRVFVSMGSYPKDSVILNPQSEMVTYRRRDDSPITDQDIYEATVRLVDGELQWVRDEYPEDRGFPRPLQEDDYPDQIERLTSAKAAVSEADDDEEREIIEGLLDAGIPKTHIREYIARYDFL